MDFLFVKSPFKKGRRLLRISAFHREAVFITQPLYRMPSKKWNRRCRWDDSAQQRRKMPQIASSGKPETGDGQVELLGHTKVTELWFFNWFVGFVFAPQKAQTTRVKKNA